MSFSDNRANSVMDCTTQDPPTDSQKAGKKTYIKQIQVSLNFEQVYTFFAVSMRLSV